MSTLTIPSPFVKHGMVFISSGYPGGALRPVYAIRHGAHGDISLKPDQTSNDYIVWHQPLLGTYNTSALVYGDIYYTLLDRGFLLAPRRADRQADLRAAAHLGRLERLHDVAVGLQRQDLPDERRRRHVRRPGGSGVQAARQELAERDAARHAGGGARQPDRPDVFEDVSHRERGAAVTCPPEARVAKAGVRHPDRARAAVVLAGAGRTGQSEPFTHVASIPGPADLVQVHGNRAYVVGHGTLRIFDIANLQAPRELGSLHLPREDLGHRSGGAADLRGGRLLRLRHPRHLQSGRAEAARAR